MVLFTTVSKHSYTMNRVLNNYRMPAANPTMRSLKPIIYGVLVVILFLWMFIPKKPGEVLLLKYLSSNKYTVH